MTDASPHHRLWTPQGFRDDPWVHAESAEALAAEGRFILPLSVFLDMGPEAREAARGRIGVRLNPPDAVEALAPFIDTLPLIALAFPAFNDGRSFSKAELLRSRYRFKGALRATGQVLVDQLPHMLRLGFDQFEVSNPVLLQRLEEGETGGIPLYYQPTAQESADAGAYSWRRRRT